MGNLGLLWPFEWRQVVRTRGYLATTILGVLLVLALGLVPRIQPMLARAQTVHVAVLDPTGRLEPMLADVIPHGQTAMPMRFTPWTRSAGALQQAVKRGTVDWGLVVQPGPEGLADARFVVIGATANQGTGVAGTLEVLIRQVLLVPRLMTAGLSARTITGVLTPPIVRRVQYDTSPFVAPTTATALVYVLIIILFMAILLYGQMLLTGVSAEKTSRVSEVLLVRVTPEELLTGKIVGQGLAGLMQFFTLLLVALGLYAADPAIRRLVNGGSPLTHLPLWGVGWAMIFFLCGFFLYGAVFVALGSAVSQPEEVRGAMGFPAMVVTVAYMLAIFGMAAPRSTVVTVLSFVPAFTPWLMFERMMLTSVPAWQPALAVALTLGAGLLMMRWAATIYRRNLLRYQPFSIKTLFTRT